MSTHEVPANNIIYFRYESFHIYFCPNTLIFYIRCGSANGVIVITDEITLFINFLCKNINEFSEHTVYRFPILQRCR